MASDPGNPWRRISIILAIAALYYLAARLGFRFASVGNNVTLIWPPTGVALAALLLFSLRAWPGVALGAAAAAISTGAPAGHILAATAGNPAAALAGAALLNHVGFRTALDRPRDVIALVALGAAVSTLISAGVGTTAMMVFEMIPPSRAPFAFGVWWIGDAMGVLVVAPALLALSTLAGRREKHLQIGATWALAATLAVLTLVPFGGWVARHPWDASAYLFFPPLIWAAMRFGTPGAALAALLVSAWAVAAGSAGTGPFLGGSLHDTLLLTWGFMGVVTVTTLLMAALLAERAEGEPALRESRERYEALFENMLDGAAVFRVVDDGEDFEFVDYNAAGQQLDHIDRKEVIGQRVTAVFPGVREFGLFDVLRRVWRTGEPERFQTAVYTDDRLSVWRDCVVYKLPSGEVVSIYRDVTEQVRGKDRFLRQRELMRRVALMSPVGIVAAGRDGRITFSNERARKILGLDPDIMADRTFYSPQWELTDLSGRLLDTDELPLGRAMATGEPVENIPLSVRRGDGRKIILSVNASPLFTPEAGGIDGAVATFEDVTDRRRAEEMLRESRARFRAVFDNALNAILVADDDARYVDDNPAACRMTGYDRDELLALSLWDLGATDDPADTRAACKAFLAEGKGSGLFPLQTKGGAVITAEFRAAAHILPGTHLSVLNDVTERVRSEAALRESEARFRQIAETIEDVFFLNDLENNRVIYVNPAYETVFGRRVDELLADPADFLATGALPDSC